MGNRAHVIFTGHTADTEKVPQEWSLKDVEDERLSAYAHDYMQPENLPATFKAIEADRVAREQSS